MADLVFDKSTGKFGTIVDGIFVPDNSTPPKVTPPYNKEVVGPKPQRFEVVGKVNAIKPTDRGANKFTPVPLEKIEYIPTEVNNPSNHIEDYIDVAHEDLTNRTPPKADEALKRHAVLGEAVVTTEQKGAPEKFNRFNAVSTEVKDLKPVTNYTPVGPEVENLNKSMKGSSVNSSTQLPIKEIVDADTAAYNALQDANYAQELKTNPEKTVGVNTPPPSIKSAERIGTDILNKEGDAGVWKTIVNKIKGLNLSAAEEKTLIEDAKTTITNRPKAALLLAGAAIGGGLLAGGIYGMINAYKSLTDDATPPATPPVAPAKQVDTTKKDVKKAYEVPKIPTVLLDQSGKPDEKPKDELKEPEAPKLKDFKQNLDPTNFPKQSDYDPNNLLGTPIDESKFKLADFSAATKDLKDALGKAYGEYAAEKNAIKQKQLWESIIHGLGYLAAGVYGMKSGVNMGGLKFEPSDWAAQYNSAKDMLDAASNNAKSVFQANKEGIEQSNKQIELNYKALVDNKSAVAAAYSRAVDNATFNAKQKKDAVDVTNAAVENSNRNALSQYGIQSASYDRKAAAVSAAEKAALDRQAKIDLAKEKAAIEHEVKLNKLQDKNISDYTKAQLNDLNKLSELVNDYDKPSNKESRSEIASTLEAALKAKGIDTTKVVDDGWFSKSINKEVAAKLLEQEKQKLYSSPTAAPSVNANDTPISRAVSKTGDGQVLLTYPDGTHEVKDKNGNVIHARQ